MVLSLARLAACLSGVVLLAVQSCQGNPDRPAALMHTNEDVDVTVDVYSPDSTNDVNVQGYLLIDPEPRGLKCKPDKRIKTPKFPHNDKKHLVGRVLVPGFNRTAVLERHNMYRARHGSPPLQLNATINAWAQEWADRLASTQQFSHRPNNKYGENLYMSWSSTNTVPSPYAAVDAWYNEIKYYDYNNPTFSASTGHFTQVVWKSSRQLGVGAARASNGAFYLVCNYSPPGNYLGQFAQNVPRLL